MFRNRFNAKPQIFHENTGEYLVETMGVKTVHDEIRQIQLAGLKLRVYNSLFQFPTGIESESAISVHPLTDVGLDKLDASIIEKQLLKSHKFRLERSGVEDNTAVLTKQLQEVRDELAQLKSTANVSADTSQVSS